MDTRIGDVMNARAGGRRRVRRR